MWLSRLEATSRSSRPPNRQQEHRPTERSTHTSSTAWKTTCQEHPAGSRPDQCCPAIVHALLGSAQGRQPGFFSLQCLLHQSREVIGPESLSGFYHQPSKPTPHIPTAIRCQNSASNRVRQCANTWIARIFAKDFANASSVYSQRTRVKFRPLSLCCSVVQMG